MSNGGIVWSLPNLTIELPFGLLHGHFVQFCLVVLGGDYALDSVEIIGTELSTEKNMNVCNKFLKFLKIEIEFLGANQPTNQKFTIFPCVPDGIGLRSWWW